MDTNYQSVLKEWRTFDFQSRARAYRLQSNAIKGEKLILEFSEIFPINGTFYNGNIGENNHFILNFPKIFPLMAFDCIFSTRGYSKNESSPVLEY